MSIWPKEFKFKRCLPIQETVPAVSPPKIFGRDSVVSTRLLSGPRQHCLQHKRNFCLTRLIFSPHQLLNVYEMNGMISVALYYSLMHSQMKVLPCVRLRQSRFSYHFSIMSFRKTDPIAFQRLEHRARPWHRDNPIKFVLCALKIGE